MADISVALELDDSQYQRGIRNAETSATRFGTTFQQQSQKAQIALSGLGQAIAGIGFAKLITESLNLGTQLTNLSNATGISIQSIKGFQDAVNAAGGNTQGANDALSDLVKNLSEAGTSGGELLTAFNRVGVGLKDLQTLSERDLMRKTIEGLAKIPDAASRSAIGMKLMGEGIKTVDFTKVNQSIDEYTARAAGIAASARAAADAQKALGSAYEAAKVGILGGLEPLAKSIAQIAKFTDEIKILVSSLLSVAVAAAGLYGISRLVGIFTGLAAAAAMAGTSTGAAFRAMFSGLGIISAFTDALQFAKNGLYLIGAAFSGLMRGTAGLGTALGAIGGGLLRFLPIIGQVLLAFELVNGAVRLLSSLLGAGDMSIKDWAERGAKALGLIKQTSKEAAAEAENKAEADKKANDEAQRSLKVLDDQKKALDSLVASYRTNAAEAVKKVQLDTLMIGKSEEYKNKQQALADLEKGYLQEVTKLRDEYTKASDPAQQAQVATAIQQVSNAYLEQRDSLLQALDAQNQRQRAQQLTQFGLDQLSKSEKAYSDLITQIATVNMPAVEKSIYNLEAAMRAEAKAAIEAEARRRGESLSLEEQQQYYDAASQRVRELTDATRQLAAAEADRRKTLAFKEDELTIAREIQNVYDDTAKLTMTDIQKKEYDIRRAAQQRADAMIRAEEAARGSALSASEREEYIRKANEQTEKLISATQRHEQQSRTWATGWKQAMNDYVRSATDGASQAKNIFSKAMTGMEDMIVNFAKTGKFEWKTFVSSMLEELLRSQVQQVFGGILGDIMSIFGMSGGNASGRGGSANNPVFVADVAGGAPGQFGIGAGGGGGLGDIWNSVKKVFTGGETQPTQPTSQGGGVWDTITGVFDTVTSSIGDFGSSIMDTFSDIGSGIMDFFDGFFANGGKIGAGRWGIAGEAGPEIIQGPSTVTPLDQLGTSMTQVTYNINAVDAMSFKQMIAADPGFIHAVAMQGGKSIPRRV